jgi:hypothetical protein
MKFGNARHETLRIWSRRYFQPFSKFFEECCGITSVTNGKTI